MSRATPRSSRSRSVYWTNLTKWHRLHYISSVSARSITQPKRSCVKLDYGLTERHRWWRPWDKNVFVSINGISSFQDKRRTIPISPRTPAGAVSINTSMPRSRTTRYGQRCFAVSGPTLWNSLPLSVRDPSLTLTQFRARLKTVLFCRAYETLA